MPDLLIRAGMLVTPFEVVENVDIKVEGGKIADVVPASAATPDVDASDKIVAPGLIDIHVHGGAGFDTMDGTYEAVAGIAQHLAKHGITSFLPSTLTCPYDEIRAALSSVKKAMDEGTGGGANVLGAHLEGPFINPKNKGAQVLEYIREPNIEEFKNELGDLIDVIKVITVAPEMPNAIEFIKFLVGRGITVSLGHSDATYEQTMAAVEAGARDLTHTYNAMRGLHHREPGLIGAALSDERIFNELIWDNLHVHPASAMSIINAKGSERVILISDAMRAAGLPEGTYSLGAHTVTVKNGEARLPDGNIAASIITLDTAVRNAASKFDVQRAIQMATYTPAEAIKVSDNKGLIEPGYDADIIVMNSDLQVEKTIIKGSLLS